MFGEYVYENSPAAYANLIWINDADRLNRIAAYSSAFTEHGFEVVEYQDDLSFRIEYEKKVKSGNEKLAVMNYGKAYVDVVELGGQHYLCAAFGFRRIPFQPSDSLRAAAAQDSAG